MAVFAFGLTAVILVGLVVFVARWKQVRGATSRYDAMRRAFGEKAAHRIYIGSLVVAAIAFICAAVAKATGG